jgi:protease I
MDKKEVALIIASKGYQPIEYSIPKNLLEQAGITVVTVSNKAGTASTVDKETGQTVTTPIDLPLKSMNVDEYDGIFFIGGPGALEHLDNQLSYDIIKQAWEKKLPLGAICISTRILAKAGILKDKRVTGWDGDNQLAGILKEHQALYQQKDVVVDGNLITAVGPLSAREFAENIITMVQEQNTPT